GDLLAAANTLFRDWGYGDDVMRHDSPEDRSTAVKGARAMMRAGLARLNEPVDEARIDANFDRFIEIYSAAIDVYTRLYPGAQAALEALLEAGYRTAICTNKPETQAEMLMQSLGVRDLFGSLIGADTLPVRKPDPAPLYASIEQAGGARGKAVLIGDTITDRKTAEAAGLPCFLVTFGPDGHNVADLNPEALLHNYSDLLQLVRQFFPSTPNV
ncbi:MAG: HAD-IA family hydrolase, partial [Mangrovicoccus sp.]